MSKKIAIFTSTYNSIYTGVGTYAQMLVDLLLKLGKKIVVVSPDCDDKPPTFIKIKKGSLTISPNSWVELAYKYSKIFNDLSKDIEIAHFLDAREALFIKKRKNIYLIGTVHDTYSFDLQSQSILKNFFLDSKKRLIYYFFLHKLEKFVYKKFDLILSNTEYVKGRLVDFYDLDFKKIKTIHLPTPIDETKSTVKIKVNPPYKISFIGGNFQRKGLLQLIKAIKILREEDLDIQLFIAGKDRNQTLIDKWIKENKINGFIKFLGHLNRQEIENLLQNSDVFAMPSITEAYGLVYLEAMAFGIPVIGTKEGGAKEIIEDGLNGFLCNPYSIEDIANKIKFALDSNIREKIIKNGFKTLDKFSKRAFLEKMSQIYENQ